MDKLKFCMPFLLATLCTITSFVTAPPTPTTPNTDIVTDLVNLASTDGGVVSASEVMQSQYTTVKQSEASTLLSNTSGNILNKTVNNGSLTGLPTSVPANTGTPEATSPGTTMTLPIALTSPVAPTIRTTAQRQTATTVHATTATVTTHVPISTSLHKTPSVSASTKSPTTTHVPPVATSATQSAVSVDEKTSLTTRHTTSVSRGVLSTSSKTTHIPDSQRTKESGDWSIIGITGNSFTGKILLPIAVGIGFSVIIIAVAYCYCSRRGSKFRQAKSSRNGVHRMTSNDRVMLLADSSEDEF